MSAKILIYHHYDQDGYLSAAIVTHFWQDKDKELRYIVGNYKEVLDEAQLEWADHIYILDYSLPTEVMAKYPNNIIWLDHHESAINKSNYLCLKGKREVGKSGCLLTWDYLYKESPPFVVHLVNDRDVWEWKLGDRSAAFHEASMSFVTDYSKWEKLLTSYSLTSEEVKRGMVILDHTRKMVDNYNRTNSWLGTFEGYPVVFLNGSSMISGEMHKRLREHNPTTEFAVLFTITKDKVGVGLYRKDGSNINMGDLARKYGGGGHAGAAGFFVPLSDLPIILAGGRGD